MALARTHLIPIQELTPGAVGAIRNQVIADLVRLVSSETSMPEDKLVVRDIRPFGDLQMYAAGTTAATVDEWLYDATTTTANAYTTVTGTATMGDQRYVALFGVRDCRRELGLHATTAGATTARVASVTPYASVVSFIKINVGGGDRAIWDISGINAYTEASVAFSPTAVIIPQNSSYNIGYYFVTTVAGLRTYLQLIGVVVEPRGKLISP